MDHIQLICDIGEINSAFTDTTSIEAFLQKIVDLVARRMGADVCSIYLYEERDQLLTLRATKGLNSESVGKIQLKLGEGLSGLAMKELRPVYEKSGREHPKFKFFPGTAEEKYDVFLAVPILRGISRIGVLVVQRGRKKEFKERDIVTLRAVASQLASMLENARLFMSMNVQVKTATRKNVRIPKLIRGKVASEGFAQGPSLYLDRDRLFERCVSRIYTDSYTITHFQKAVTATEVQLEEMQERVEEKLSDVASLIFAAHLLLLKDKEFIGSMVREIEEGCSPPQAIINVARHYIEIFSHGSNAYIREKVQDIEDVTIRLLGNLVSDLQQTYQCKNHVVIANELFPSDMLKLSSQRVEGIVLATGGVTSHLSILARSLGIPMMIADTPKLQAVPDGTPAILDAESGNLYLNPAPAVVASFRSRNEARKRVRSRKQVVLPQTTTVDGKRIGLLASINLFSDLKLAHEMQCEGVGLYRTEFPFLIRSDFPTEEEQYVIYRQLVEGMPGKEITFRTLDIGGDKVLSYYETTHEQNPFLGMRSIRFSLSNKALFVQQIRAMLRAGFDAPIRIMFPFISSVEEYLDASNIVEECIRQLSEEKIPHNSRPSLGVMIEIPSVVNIINELAREAQFFSIGTNDLVQYMLAVDRTNEKVSSLFLQHHPSILRTIKQVVDAARQWGIRMSVCGDMVHQERYLPFFIGVGISEFSLDPSFVPRIQECILKTDTQEAEKIAASVLSCGKIAEIAKILK